MTKLLDTTESQRKITPSAVAPCSPGVAAVLAMCHRLRDAACQMTRQQFRNCLNRSIGADKDYADNCLRHFRDNPAAYLASRSPQDQSRELLRVMLKMTENIKVSHDHSANNP